MHRGQDQTPICNGEGFRNSSLNECLYSRRCQERLPWTVRSEGAAPTLGYSRAWQDRKAKLPAPWNRWNIKSIKDDVDWPVESKIMVWFCSYLE